MSDKLEQRLLALGTALDVPAAPDAVPAVLARLPARRRRRRRPAGRVLAVAIAAMLLLVGAAMAVPPSRNAILRAIGLRGVSIKRVPKLPPVPAGSAKGARLGLGEPITLARARRAAGFTALLPARATTAVYLAHDVPGGRISMLVGPVLITEFRGTAQPFIFKLLGPGTKAAATRVDGAQGIYISGAPHEVLFQTSNGEVRSDRVRLAGNVLIWQQGPLIIRIEGTHTLARALTLARSLR
jgi:hypothetical protein